MKDFFINLWDALRGYPIRGEIYVRKPQHKDKTLFPDRVCVTYNAGMMVGYEQCEPRQEETHQSFCACLRGIFYDIYELEDDIGTI